MPLHFQETVLHLCLQNYKTVAMVGRYAWRLNLQANKIFCRLQSADRAWY